MKKTKDFHPMIDRYYFDAGKCSLAKGYAQIDTTQDASYFGTWANPWTLTMVNYCEGDIYIDQAETDAEFTAMILNMKRWNDESGYWIGIDHGTEDKARQRWQELELDYLLH